MFKYLILLALAACSLGCDKFPNSTHTAVHWYSCDSGDASTASQITVTDQAGNPDYPINVKTALTIHMTQNNAGPQVNHLYVDVGMASWSDSGFMGCKWVSVPTFGLTNNLDACKLGGAAACPMKSGASTNAITIDLSQFGPVLTLLSTGKAYQISMKMKNGDVSSKPEIGCIVIQATITKG